MKYVILAMLLGVIVWFVTTDRERKTNRIENIEGFSETMDWESNPYQIRDDSLQAVKEKEDEIERQKLPKDVLKFQDWLPRCINNCSQYELQGASYNSEQNLVTVYVRTNYTKEFADDRKNQILYEEEEFWTNYIEGQRQIEARRLKALLQNHYLSIRFRSKEMAIIGTVRM